MAFPMRSAPELLRLIVRNLGNEPEAFLERFTVSELVAIGRAQLAADWEIPPHRWTPLQLRAALKGQVPRWNNEGQPVEEPEPAHRFGPFPATLLALVLALVLGVGACGGEPVDGLGEPEAVTSPLVGVWRTVVPPARTWTFGSGGYTYTVAGSPGLAGAYTADGSTITIEDGGSGQAMPYALTPCAQVDIPRPAAAADCLTLANMGYFRD